MVVCSHTIEHFMSEWSIYDPPTTPGSELIVEDSERHESPFVAFPSKSFWNGSVTGEVDMVPILSASSNREHDVAVVELGGGEMRRPFAAVPLDIQRPAIGDVVQFAGLYQNPEPPVDRHGYPLGFRLVRGSARVVALCPQGFLIDFPVIRGMSGSGVCNEQGLLQGIIIERWELERSARLVGIQKVLGLVAYSEWVVEEYYHLLDKAKQRIATGGFPWGGREL
jgi:hypothetical protein